MMGDETNPKRLRIAVLNRNFSPTGGGAERYSIALVEELAQRHEIHVFAQNIEHQWPGVTYHRLWTPLSKPRWINQIWFAVTSWWVTRHGFDVVHSHENTWHGQVQTVHVLPIKYNLFVGRSGWRLALRWLKVVTSPRLLSYLFMERLRYDARDGRSIVLTSPSLMAIMAATYPKAQSAMVVVTPGVKSVPGLASEDERRAARIRLGLPLEGTCILFVGNDYRKKGLPVLIDALSKLPCYYYLAVVGNSSQIPPFSKRVEILGLQSRVFFLGSLNDISAAYLASNCLVHPTLEDTFAMVVLEAMAHGLPVVVSSPKYCGISQLLVNGKSAIILEDPLDSSELFSSIKQVNENAITRNLLSSSAQTFVIKSLWTEISTSQDFIYKKYLSASSTVPE
jgi:UDP-glucose:(heptosyl)LPS alpha-1,3-glucosyltransferase